MRAPSGAPGLSHQAGGTVMQGSDTIRRLRLPATNRGALPHRGRDAAADIGVGRDHAVAPHTSLSSARHLETAFFRVEPAESLTP